MCYVLAMLQNLSEYNDILESRVREMTSELETGRQQIEKTREAMEKTNV